MGDSDPLDLKFAGLGFEELDVVGALVLVGKVPGEVEDADQFVHDAGCSWNGDGRPRGGRCRVARGGSNHQWT